MSDEIVTLAKFANPIEAEMAKNRLAEEGITSFVSGAMTNAVFGMNNIFGEVQLLVAAAHFIRARAILEGEPENEATDEPEDEPAPGPSTAIKAPDWARPLTREQNAAEESKSIQRAPGITPDFGADPGSDLQAAEPAIEKDKENRENREEDYRLQNAWGPDDYAILAWKSAVIGLLILPPLLHIYSLGCLAKLFFFTNASPSAAGMRNVVRAAILDTLVIAFVLSILCSGLK